MNITAPIPDANIPLLTLLQGTGVRRVIISARRIEFFPRLTPPAIDRLTSPDNGPLYTDVMRLHFAGTRDNCTLMPGDFDISGPEIKSYDTYQRLKRAQIDQITPA